jgi:hypothetical protein
MRGLTDETCMEVPLMNTHDSTDLYRFYDHDGRLLYVGISFSAVARASQHRAEKPWWPDVANMTVEHLPSRAAAMAAELAAIRTEKPIHNVAGVARHHNRAPKRYRVAGNYILVVEARTRRAVWGGTEIVVTNCPECGNTHRHGVLDTEIHRGIAYRYPHCHGIRPGVIRPWQIIRFPRRNMNLDPAYSDDEDYTRNGNGRQWSHRQFRNWVDRNQSAAVA